MHCELVIPGLFSAPAEARLPSLELLLARGRARSGESQPLERWLAEAFGLGLFYADFLARGGTT